jgi:hypothetical protein
VRDRRLVCRPAPDRGAAVRAAVTVDPRFDVAIQIDTCVLGDYQVVNRDSRVESSAIQACGYTSMEHGDDLVMCTRSDALRRLGEFTRPAKARVPGREGFNV